MRNLRFALRTLGRSPGFTAIAILTLAVGIGANTAIFSIFDSVLLKPLPYRNANRLVAIQEVVPRLASIAPMLPVSAWHFREWRKHSRAFEDIALLGQYGMILTVDGEPRQVVVGRVSASYFPILGIQAQLGRTFLEEEDQPGRDRVLVLSNRTWSRRFRSDPNIVGQKILLNGAPYEVIGVLPANAQLPKSSQLYNMGGGGVPDDMWKPFAIGPNDLAINAEYDWPCLGRLKPGVTIAQATADLDAIQHDIVKDLPDKPEIHVTMATIQDQITGRSRQSLALLLAAVAAVLLIGCVNIANLMLARAVGRRKELAIRTALGAGLGRLLGQTLAESLVVAVAGGALGVTLANWGLGVIIKRAPVDVPRLAEAALDTRALLFAAAVSIASGLLFGLAPAWRMARIDPQTALKSGGRTSTERGAGRRVLVGVEVALSAMCLVVGGLLLHSFARLLSVDTGFQPERTVAVSLGLPGQRYPNSEAIVAFVRNLLGRAQALPGVAAAGVANRLPLSGEGSNNGIYAEDSVLPPDEHPTVDYRCVTPDYLRAIGIPMVSGRMFSESDRDHYVGLVSTRTARRLWGDANPIGRHFRLGGPQAPLIEVVGTAADVHGVSLQKAPNLTVYVPFWQRVRSDFSLVARAAAGTAPVASALRATIHELDPQLPNPRSFTMDEVIDSSVAQRRFQLDLVLLFAAAALLLAGLGVYGVVSHSVTQRTNEIGIRMALGASRPDVWRLIVRQGLTPVGAGLIVGLAGGLAAARLVSGMLFGVRAADPLTFAAVAGVLLGAAVVACLVPALRATRVDPLIALRYE